MDRLTITNAPPTGVFSSVWDPYSDVKKKPESVQSREGYFAVRPLEGEQHRCNLGVLGLALSGAMTLWGKADFTLRVSTRSDCHHSVILHNDDGHQEPAAYTTTVCSPRCSQKPCSFWLPPDSGTCCRVRLNPLRSPESGCQSRHSSLSSQHCSVGVYTYLHNYAWPLIAKIN